MANSRKTEYEIGIQVGGKVAESFSKSIANVNNSFDSMVNMANNTAANVNNSFGSMVNMANNTAINVNSGFESMVSMAKSAVGLITAAFATVQAGQFIGDAIETYAEFEQSMANTAATANATRQEYGMLEQAAREMGKATTKTAAEASDALGYMMLAGWGVEEAISGLEPVLRLSEATQMDLARCSDLVTDSMSALGLSVDELSEYLDMCTSANNNANTTAEALMEAFIGCGGAAKTVGADINDMATALGVLANNGTKGAEAGTAMNSMLVRMTSKDVAINAMKELGVAVFNDAGEFRGLQNVLVDVQGALSSLTTEEQTSYMSRIAGTNYYTEMSYLLDAVKLSTAEMAETAEDADGVWDAFAGTANNNISAWDNLSQKLDNSDGALLNMADTVTDTLQGAFSRLESATDDAKISLAGAFSDDLKDTVNDLSAYIPVLTQKFIDFSVKAGPKISKAFDAVTKGAGEAWEVVSNAGRWVIDNFGTVETLIAGVGGAVITYKVVSGLAGTAAGIKNIGAAMKAMAVSNPWLTGITLAASAIMGIASAVREAEKQAVKSNLAGHFGDIALSMEDISEAAEYIIADDKLSGIHESLEAFGDLSGIADDMQQSIDAVNKMNWKVSVGMELSGDEQDSYLSEIQNYISQARSYVEQEQYAMNLNLELFAEGDSGRQDIVEQLNNFYSDKHAELEEAGRKLNEAVTEAFLDGFLDPDEAKEIAELQESMARIQEKLAASDFDAKMKVMELQYSGVDLDADSFIALQEELAAQVEVAAAEYEDSLQLRIANYQIMLDDGAIDKQQYDAAVSEFWEDYLASMSELEARSLNFQTNTIMQAYSEELGPAIDSYMQAIQKTMDSYQEKYEEGSLVDWAGRSDEVALWNGLLNELSKNDLDKTTRGAIEKLLESLQPSMERMEKLKEQYEGFGAELPAVLSDSVSDVELLNALTKDGESIYRVLGQQMADSEFYTEMVNTLTEKGGYVPEAVAEGMAASTGEYIVPAVDGLYADSDAYLQETFSQGFEVTADVNVNLNPVYPELEEPSLPKGKGQNHTARDKGSKIVRTGHADGGIFNIPHVAWFAEDGPEAAIPLDGSSNAISLWERAGQLLGVFDGGMQHSKAESLYNGMSTHQDAGSSAAGEAADSLKFVYAPQIYIEGNAGREDIDDIITDKMEEFREMMEQYVFEKKRVALG